MSDGIVDQAFIQVAGRKLAWHKKMGGEFVIGEYPSEGIRKLGRFDVERSPLAAWSEEAQAWQPIPSHFALLRQPIPSDPTYKSMGVVSRDYEVVQHMQLAQSLDKLVDVGWQLETAGVLHEGAMLFMSFNAGGYVVNEDEIQSYWCASVRHAASAMNIFATPVRVVCRNTYAMGMGRATDRISIPHYRSAAQELEWATDVLARTHAREQTTIEELTAMGETPMDVDTFTQVLDAAYPLPKPIRRMAAIQQRVTDLGGSYQSLETDTLDEYTRLSESFEAKRALMQRLRDAVTERVVAFNDERPQYSDSAWSVWNALSEVESHRSGKNPGYQILFGERGECMARGYRELVKVAAAR